MATHVGRDGRLHDPRLELVSKMPPRSPMSFPHVVGGNPDLAQNSPIDSTVPVWIPDRYLRE